MIDYTTFSKLIAASDAFPTFEEFFDAYGNSIPVPSPIIATKAFDIIWQMGNSGLNIKRIAAACGRSMRNIAQSYSIPYRTLQNWSEGNNSTSRWTLTLLAYALFTDRIEILTQASHSSQK